MGAYSFPQASREVLYTSTPTASRLQVWRVSSELLSFEAKSGGSRNFSAISTKACNAKREAKADLWSSQQKLGISNAATKRTLKRSDNFVDDLQSKFQSIHESPDEAVTEVALAEIQDALVPYVGSVKEEHDQSLGDIIESQPNQDLSNREKLKLRTISKVSKPGLDGQLPAQVRYLMDIGLSHDQIKDMVRRFPELAYCTLDAKVKPCIEFLLQLDVPPSEIPIILYKHPHLVGSRVQEKLLQSKKYLEGYGIDKQKWPLILRRGPALLCHSEQKVDATVDYLEGLGISPKTIGNILTIFPKMIDYNVESKLKPVTDFLFEIGFNMEEVGLMVSRFPNLCGLSLQKNLQPKWDFFVTMDYCKSKLVSLPVYFGYSLERRIKPRYQLMVESGLNLSLDRLLFPSDDVFEKSILKGLIRLQNKDPASS